MGEPYIMLDLFLMLCWMSVPWPAVLWADTPLCLWTVDAYFCYCWSWEYCSLFIMWFWPFLTEVDLLWLAMAAASFDMCTSFGSKLKCYPLPDPLVVEGWIYPEYYWEAYYTFCSFLLVIFCSLSLNTLLCNWKRWSCRSVAFRLDCWLLELF